MPDLQDGDATSPTDGCPYIVTDETTSHCILAESGVRSLEVERDALAAKAEAGKRLYEAATALTSPLSGKTGQAFTEEKNRRNREFRAALARWEAVENG